MIKDKTLIKKIIISVLLIFIAVISCTVISHWASSPSTHASSIAVLDDKKTTAMGLTTAVAVTSTAITAIPGDVATPIATQVSELTTPLLIVICAIYLEKFLLTITGYVSFTFLIPIACVAMGIYVFSQKEFFRALSIKLALFGIVIFLLVPASVKITNLIEATFEESISQTLDMAEEIEKESQNASEEDTNSLLDFLSGIGSGVTSVVDNAKNALGVFVDAIAVLIITSCVIPVAVLALFAWVTKIILGADIKGPDVSKLSSKIENKIGFMKK